MLIDLIRHGATEPPGLLLGRTDPPLSPTGWRQFEAQTEGRTWPRIVSSPLLRAREAAESLAAKRGLAAHIDSNWAELDFGAWDGQPVSGLREDPAIAAQLDAFYSDEDAAPPEGGESWSALRTRVANALDELLETAPESDDAAPSALVVTHGGPIRTALALTCNLPFAHLWTLRIAYGTRISLRFGRTEDETMWGELIEIVQP
ncbi:histidine phosphatase family protein [Methyloligella solikamskensis]|uniref:Histidine phosphatase family protein n=1 Tax=Methyloligella solikamskensis TaxID=1177756 RepID=A0ABW3J9T7_9HYPH